MKHYMKPFCMLIFLLILGAVLAVSHYEENNTMLESPIVSRQELDSILSGKQMAVTPTDLLLYQSQPLPYRQDSNTYLLPVLNSDKASGSLDACNYGKIYLLPDDNSNFTAYVVNDTEYYETYLILTSSVIMTFRTESFENKTSYGVMNLYTPQDSEIGTYSFKSSDAKLSYETYDQLLFSPERNYELKIMQKVDGKDIQHNMNLAGLRNDDDWELDPLMGYSDEILQFYELWNAYCMDSGLERFTVSYQTVEFYLDEQYMGPYLLRVPIDDKQLNYTDGLWMTEADASDALYSQEIQSFLDRTIYGLPLRLECYYRQEESEISSVIYAFPRRFRKIIEQP